MSTKDYKQKERAGGRAVPPPTPGVGIKESEEWREAKGLHECSI